VQYALCILLHIYAFLTVCVVQCIMSYIAILQIYVGLYVFLLAQQTDSTNLINARTKEQ